MGKIIIKQIYPYGLVDASRQKIIHDDTVCKQGIHANENGHCHYCKKSLLAPQPKTKTLDSQLEVLFNKLVGAATLFERHKLASDGEAVEQYIAQIKSLLLAERDKGKALLAKSILMGDGELSPNQTARLQAIVDKRLAKLERSK